MTKYTGLEIAVIGMSGRFPDAENVEQLWQNLKNGVESVRFHTEEELLASGEDPDLIDDPLYVKANVVMEGKENFDSAFFGYRPDEAKLMDPQTRIFHECVWEALEDAGCVDTDLQKIGLFAGSSNNINWGVYSEIINQDKIVDDYSAAHLSNSRFLATRLSYFFNLKGPSVYVDTACSTSLVAVHQACSSLLMANCNIALAGGITITNAGKEGYLYQEGMIHSRDGHCRTFDAKASGTIGGEGAGVVVLKTLKNALKDGDNIHAIIRGSAINNDGKEKVGYTAPSVEGQAETIMTAQKWAKVSPETISYVEAHGTATPLGDPIEVEALKLAFGESDHRYCALGSVKSNMGHLDAAAGITGLIKTVLALKNRQLPPSLHYEQPNPRIKFENSPFYVNTELRNWKNGEHPLRAGVSSFGIGGTNAHVVLEEAPDPAESSCSRNHHMLPLSAKSASALERNTSRLLEYLEQHPNADLADISYTLRTGRKGFPYRRSIVCGSVEEAIELLKSQKSADKITPVRELNQPKVVFMFSGQGSQYVEMARDLIAQEPTFRKVLDECFAIYNQITGKDLESVLFSGEARTPINETQYTQPLLFSIEYALTRLLKDWGVEPDQLIGHSIGEYVAACVGGIFTMEDALTLVIKRGELMQRAPKGSMLSVSLSFEELQPYLQKASNIDVAAFNTTNSIVLSGPDEAIQSLSEKLDEAELPNRFLHTSHAFHSEMMEGILDDFRDEMDKVELKEPNLPIINNDSGKVDSQMQKAEYWVKQIRKSVNFSEGLATVLEQEAILIEVGPGKSLCTFARNHEKRTDQHAIINLMRHPKEQQDDQAYLMKAIGQLWEAGFKMDHKKFYGDEARKLISLPTYSFEKTPYPVRVNAYKMIAGMITDGGDRKISDPKKWMYRPNWQLAPALKPSAPAVNNVLLLANTPDLNRIRARYESDGSHVKVISISEIFEKLDDDTYTVGVAHSSRDFHRIFEEFHTQNWSPDILVHAFGVDDSGVDNLDEYKHYYSLLDVFTAWRKMENLISKQVVILSRDLHPVTKPTKEDQALKSLSLGWLKVLSQEHATITTAHIDITSDHLKQTDELERVYQELLDQANGKVVALRHGTRFLRFYEPLSMNQGKGEGFRKLGTYLITGGLGKLGYQLARYLLKNYEANLILINRSDLQIDVTEPERGSVEWRFQELQQLSGNVMYLPCDVSDVSQLTRVVEKGESHFGRIHGVIHAAAHLGDHMKPLDELSIEEAQTQLLPKVHGVQSISKAFDGRTLDFCMLTSSLSAVLGGLGFGAYAPANAYLDYFTLAEGSQKWISINLDGLSLDQPSDKSITATELVQVVEQVLKSEEPQVIVSTTDLKRRLDKWILRSVEKEEELSPEEQKSGSSYLSLVARITEFWQDFFGNATIDEEDDFFELGGDSLQALTMIHRMHQKFGVDISIKEFFNRPTAKLIAAFIEENDQEQNDKLIAIEPVIRKPHHALSSAQKRLYFLWQFDPDSLAYNMPKVLKLQGHLNREEFESTFQKLIARHEVFRTAFIMEGKEPRQKVLEQVDFSIDHQVVRPSEVPDLITTFVRPFDLSNPPLIRVSLLELQGLKNEHLLLIDVHHMITDGVSMGVLIDEFIALFEGQELAVPDLHYIDFAEWQQQEEQQQRILKQKAFWLGQFAEPVQIIDLPADRLRPAVKSYQGASVNVVLPEQQTNQLKALAEAENATVFMVLLALYKLLLSKLSNEEDLVVGTPVAGRPHPQLEKMMGIFVNTLPIRSNLKEARTFKDLLHQIKHTTLRCFDNQEYPYEELIDELQVQRDTSRNPLFDVMFSYLNYKESKITLPGISLSAYGHSHDISQFDLTMVAVEKEGRIHVELEYATALFERSRIEGFMESFQTILNQTLSNPSIPLSEISLLSEQETDRILNDFNDTSRDFKVKEKTIVSAFEACAVANAKAPALAFDGKALNYRELNEMSNALAHTLIARGVRAEDRIGVLVPRSSEMIISLLAVLKAGGAYIPLDPNYPVDRVKDIIEDSGLKLLLTGSDFSESAIDNMDVTAIDVSQSASWSNNLEAPSVKIRPENLAYLIYTSGSTGRPKGVMIEHRSVINFIYGVRDRIRFEPDECMLCLTTVSFDIFVLESFLPLLTGMRVVLAREQDQQDPGELLKLTSDEGVGMMQITPSHLNMLLASAPNDDILPEVHTLMVGGEALPADLLTRLKERFSGKIYNMYGPTETTIWSTIQELTSKDQIDIGKAIANTTVRIVDNHMNLQPVGIVGELCIGGAGLARGYWNREKLTGEKFVPDPFVNDARIYRTGDLARWKTDGTIECLGRKDDQVKIRGFRIEPGEVENQLASQNQVNQAVILVREVSGEKQLVGYYTSDEPLDSGRLRIDLSNHLPEYMIPSYLVHLEAFPLTPNGKINKRALPEPKLSGELIESVPINEFERVIHALWSQVLGMEEVGTDIDFFLAGGNSIKLIELFKLLDEQFPKIIKVRTLFQHSTIQKMARYIEDQLQQNEPAKKKNTKIEF